MKAGAGVDPHARTQPQVEGPTTTRAPSESAGTARKAKMTMSGALLSALFVLPSLLGKRAAATTCEEAAAPNCNRNFNDDDSDPSIACSIWDRSLSDGNDGCRAGRAQQITRAGAPATITAATAGADTIVGTMHRPQSARKLRSRARRERTSHTPGSRDASPARRGGTSPHRGVRTASRASRVGI